MMGSVNFEYVIKAYTISAHFYIRWLQADVAEQVVSMAKLEWVLSGKISLHYLTQTMAIGSMLETNGSSSWPGRM
jgi:hypothetical protein